MLAYINSFITFGYSSEVKRIAKHCAYTGKTFNGKTHPTFEHIRPHCKGGKNNISNCLAVTKEINNKRGCMPFIMWIKKFPEVIQHIQDYLNELRGQRINNVDYVEAVKKTLNEEAKGLAVFV